MRYEEIRRHVQEHFRQLLLAFKGEIAADGPPDAHRLYALRATEALAGGDPETWLATTHAGDAGALLIDFCARRDIAEGNLSEANRRWLLEALQAGHASMASEALSHVSSLAHFDLTEGTQQVVAANLLQPRDLHASVPSKSVKEVASVYFDEIRRTAPIEPKTELDRKEVLELFDEITGHKPVNAIAKSDAQKVKQILLRLPWNRNKMAVTRGKPLAEMLEVQGIRVISSRRVATHLGNLHAFFKWAVANGYAEANVFDGMQVKAAKPSQDERKGSYSSEQLQVMFSHLTESASGLVRKDVHRWGTLIAMFSGMRVNEVAQLDLADIKQDGEVWYSVVPRPHNVQSLLYNGFCRLRSPFDYSATARPGEAARISGGFDSGPLVPLCDMGKPMWCWSAAAALSAPLDDAYGGNPARR